MTPADTFPYASSLSRKKQVDHTVPYDQGGETGVGNYGPMTTRHHRIKTHGGWQVQQPFPGIYVWRDPHGALLPRRPHRHPTTPRHHQATGRRDLPQPPAPRARLRRRLSAQAFRVVARTVAACLRRTPTPSPTPHSSLVRRCRRATGITSPRSRRCWSTRRSRSLTASSSRPRKAGGSSTPIRSARSTPPTSARHSPRSRRRTFRCRRVDPGRHQAGEVDGRPVGPHVRSWQAIGRPGHGEPMIGSRCACS